jgi:cytochrome c556
MSKPSFFFGLFASAVAATAVACAPPHRDVPAADVPKLASLEVLMDVQATVADPQMKKAGASTYTDADYASFGDLSARIQATSAKTKDFSKGPEFDGFADKLHETAVALGKAAEAKDAKASSDSLRDMKATCKACHSKFR